MPKPVSKPAPPRVIDSSADFTRTKSGHLLPSSRTYKPTSRGRGRGRGRARGRGRGRPGNMTLDNSRRPYQSVLLQISGLFTILYILIDLVELQSVNISTNPVLASQLQVRKCLYSPCPLTHFKMSLRNVCLSRCLQSWPHLHVSARSLQNRHLLELLTRQLPQYC